MTHNRIIIPTVCERTANYSYAWTGYDLDKSIEAADARDSFFVSAWRFQEQTIARLGIDTPTVSTRQRIREAFSKAHDAIIVEICEMQWRERNRTQKGRGLATVRAFHRCK